MCYQAIRHERGIRTDGYPSPNVTIAELALLIFGDVLSFRVNKRPDFIATHFGARQVFHHLVVVIEAGLAGLTEQTHDGVLELPVLRTVAGAVSFTKKAGESRRGFCALQFMLIIMLERSGIVMWFGKVIAMPIVIVLHH